MRYLTLRNRPKCFQAFSGLRVEEFDQLVTVLRGDWLLQREQRLEHANPKRQRQPGAGRKLSLPALEDQLLLVLVWSRLYPVYLVLEYLFAIDESTVSRTIRQIQPLLQSKYILPKRLPRKKVRSLEELKGYLPPGIELDDILIDATEQVIPRPVSKRKRKPYHSGKKRKFTLKTQLTTTKQGLIIHLSDTVGGRMHDYKLFQQSGLPEIIPKGSKLYLDGGYQGIRKDFPALIVAIPFKRHRGKAELAHSEKIYNKKQRRVRIRVENTLAKLKKYQVLSQTYRHSLQNYNQTFRFVANIVNFRMLQRLQTG